MRRLGLLSGLLPVDSASVPIELIAGVTLAALAIPEVLGYASIAGMPAVTGLYTMLVPMVVFAVFGSSRHLVVGADSATAAILAGGLVVLAAPESPEYVALAAAAALITAVWLLLARSVGLAFLADFLSRSVLVGFLTGVGLQVAATQIGGMLGVSSSGAGTVDKLLSALSHLSDTSVPTLAVSMGVLARIFGLRTVTRRIPAALVALVGSIAASYAFNLQAIGVTQLGPVPGGLPAFGVPDVSWSSIQALLPTTIAMFVVILAQSAATSRAYAARYDERLSENNDLVGLALANLGASLSGAFVVNGSPTKTEMVDGAGGRSQLSQVACSVVVLGVLLFLTGPLAYLPNAALAAIVFVIGLELVDIAGMRRILYARPREFWVALLTTVVVVGVGVEQGIIVAMAASLISHTRRGYSPHNSVLEKPVNCLCVDCTAIDDVDFTGGATLCQVAEKLRGGHTRLFLANVSDHVRMELDRSGVTTIVGKDAYLSDLTEARGACDDAQH